MAQKLAEKAEKTAVQILAQLTVQHWMNHHQQQAQISCHLQTDITICLQIEKETEMAAQHGWMWNHSLTSKHCDDA